LTVQVKKEWLTASAN